MWFPKIADIGVCTFVWMIIGCAYSQRTGTLENILRDYDPQLPPDYDSGIPVPISVQIAVLSLDSINENSMDYSMTIYLRQTWMDNRLKYEPFNVTVFGLKKVDPSHEHAHSHDEDEINYYTDDVNATMPTADPNQNRGVPGAHFHLYKRGQARTKEGKLELDVHAMDKIWVPDTFFYNERVAIFHDVTVPNKLLHIYSNGTVYYSMRISLTLTCHMELSKYPFDRQQCLLQLGTYGYTDEILAYFWHEHNPATFPQNLHLPTFHLTAWNLESCDQEEFEGVNVGKFSCLNMVIKLARSYGFYVAQIYVPSVLVVILSWVSFWLDIEAIPARISLGLLTVLTTTTMSVGSTWRAGVVTDKKNVVMRFECGEKCQNERKREYKIVPEKGARSSLPRVSYLKALDVWNAVCLLFVFAALLEFAYVNVHTRVEKRRMSMRDAVNLARGKDSGPKTGISSASRVRARGIDKMSRMIFPATFLTFNVFYWCFYMI